MHKQKNFIFYFFTIIIFGILISFPINYILISKNIIKLDTFDNNKTFIKKENTFLDKIENKLLEKENIIINKTTNYFPGYMSITHNFYETNLKIDSLFTNDVYLKNNSDNEYLFYNNKYDFFHLVNNLSKEDMDERLNNQIDFYNNLSNTNVNIYMYMPLRYEVTNIDSTRNLNNYVNEFKNNLNNKIKVGTLETKDENDYLQYFYRTDHHYNAYGALKAYQDIMKLMNIKDNTNYNIKEIKSPYYGSLAKTSLITKTSDTLTDIDINKTYEINNNDTKFKPRIIPENKSLFYDYYISYFNGQYDEIKYSYNNKTNHNLLIISDSLAWQIDYLIASHYDNTYVINLRYGKWQNNKLLINDYIKDNNITDILFLQEAESEMFDVYNHNIKSEVVF